MSGIRHIAVAGNGPVAWIAAAGLSRAFRHRGIEVSVVDTGPSADARIGRWTLPSQRGIHGLLGIAEPHVVQHTGATFKLATEHLGWQGDGSRYLHAHGEIGMEFGGTPFYKFLLSEALAGRPERPEAFSLAGTAARLGRFARPMGEGRSLTSSFTYGFHFEEAAYSNYLRELALRLGVRAVGAPLADVISAVEGAIDGLRLADGTTVQADYYVDCSGPEAHLISRLAAGRVDWSKWLPCDRMWSALGPAMRDAAAITQTLATASGWAWRAPLAQSSMVGYVYSRRFQHDDAARTAFAALEPALRGEPRLTRFHAGRRESFWQGNCLAIGAAAVELEPLVGADLHLALVGLANFIELFPRDRASSVEATEYNRVMVEYADALRDFTLAHYRAGTRRAGEFWDAVHAEPLPEALAHRLDLYAANGRIELHDHESFEETDWAWLLIGSGCRLDALELLIRNQLARLAREEAMALRAHVQQVAASMPPHVEFLRRQAAAARAPG
jgi:tryptophan halogenase